MNEKLIISEPVGLCKTPPDGITLYPFTLIGGDAGMGVSLLLQTIHLIRNRRWILLHHLLRLPDRERDTRKIVRDAIIRVYRPFLSSGMLSLPIYLGYTDGNKTIEVEISKKKEVRLSADFAEEVDEISTYYYDGVSPSFPVVPSAAYIPADRSEHPELNASHVIKNARNWARTWGNNWPNTVEGQWIRKYARQSFGGEMLWNGKWVWHCEGMQLPPKVLPAGYRQAWDVIFLAEALFTWRSRNEISPNFALHVEEPEAHLFPEAQGAMTCILAYLVNSGFRVVASTHSLIVVYLTNNLIAASEIPDEYTEPGIPSPEVRLKRSAGGYFVWKTGEIADLLDAETGYISEAEMAKYGEFLVTMGNRIDVISAYGPDT